MSCEGTDETTRHHRQLIDDHPPRVLIAGKEHIDVSVVQGSLTANTDVAASVQGVPSHGMGHPVLERDARELVFVLPSQRVHEHAGHPLDHSALAGSG